MNSDYYVYMFYDPSNGLPYYIGKGRRQRITKHLTMARKGERYPLADKIRSLWKKNERVFYCKVAENLSEDVAYRTEEFLIKQYGRRCDGGTLLNISLGGEGGIGLEPWNKGKNLSEENKLKVSEGLKVWYSENTSHRLGAEGLSKWTNPKSDATAWKNADIFYSYWKLGCGSRTLNSVFSSVSKTTFTTIVGYFVEGWNPLEDVQWLNFSKDRVEIEEEPFRVFKGTLYPDVYRRADQLFIMFKTRQGAKAMSKLFGKPPGAYITLVNRFKSGYDPNNDPVFTFAKYRSDIKCTPKEN